MTGEGTLGGDMLVLAGTFFATLIPVLGIAAAFVFVDEVISGTQWIGAALIIVAAGAVSRLQRE